MYSLFLSKQASKFCGTRDYRLQVTRMTEGADKRYSNCSWPEEGASHLNQCPNILRMQQFLDLVRELEKWLSQDHTDVEIAISGFLIPRYPSARNGTTF